MDSINKKIININRVEAIKRKDEESQLELLIGYSIFENVNGKEIKYAMWFTKQDKNETKAYSQYKSQGLNIGSSVGIAYKETPNNFQFKDRVTGEMKEAKSTNRTIVWFSEPANIEEYAENDFMSGLKEQARQNAIPTIKVPTDEELINVSQIPF